MSENGGERSVESETAERDMKERKRVINAHCDMLPFGFLDGMMKKLTGMDVVAKLVQGGGRSHEATRRSE